MSLGARATKGGARGGKDRQEKKDKPQPKEKVKPQATTEQIRMANMIDRKTSDDGADVRKMVQDLMEMTCRTEEEVCSALHDSDNDVVAACNILLEAEKTGEWQTSEKKKKKPSQPVNNGEAAPRERGPPGPRPRRGDGERGLGGERGARSERGRGAGRGGRGGGRGGRGGARGPRGPPRSRSDLSRDFHPDINNDTNQMGDGFPATEDWDNEEWSGSLSDTKVFTPSAAALPPAEPDSMLPPMEDWDSSAPLGPGAPSADPIPTYTYHSSQPHHVNMEQMNSGSGLSSNEEHYLQQQQHVHVPPAMMHVQMQPPPPPHKHQPMGMSGSLTAAQSQYLTQLTQQSQRHDASVYASTYGVYGAADSAAQQRKPQQRARVPPPSKIPVSAVEMPGGGEACGMFLDVQFGALEPDALRDPLPAPVSAAAPVSTSAQPPAPVATHTHLPPTSNHVPPSSAAAAPPAPVDTPVLPAAPAPLPAPPASLPAHPPQTKQPYETHHSHHTILSESLSGVEAPPAPAPAPAPADPPAASSAQSSLEKQLSASMKQLSVSASDGAPASAAPAHAPYAPPHRPKQQTVSQQQQQQNVYAHHPASHHPAAVYGTYPTQVNSSNASLNAAAAGISAAYPASVTLTQYQPILNYQTSSSAGVYNNSALYTAPAAPYSYQPQPHHKHKDSHQYDTSSAAASNSLTSTSTTSQTSTAKVATTTGAGSHTTVSGSGGAGAAAGGAGGAYAAGTLYGSQPYAPYDDQMMRSTMPHHMGGYYEVGYGVSGSREAGFGLGGGERFGRTDAASPQQVPPTALPPGYAYFYQPPPPTSYQYGVYPTYGGGSSVGGVAGVGGVTAGGKVTSYAQQQQPQYDAQESYKPGGAYSGGASKAGGAAAADLTNAIYAKGHVALNKVNSYEKAAFHSGTPPPFGATSHLYIPAPPHHHHVPQQHQMDVRTNSSQNRRESGSAGGRAASNKQAHTKPNYAHSYWPPN